MNRDLEELIKACTVKLILPGRSARGSGFFVAPGYILTCEHVIRNGDPKNIQVDWGSKMNFAKAEVKLPLPENDIALLSFQLHQDHPCVLFGDNPKSRDKLYLFGYPDMGFPDGCPVTPDHEGLTGKNPPEIKFAKGQIRPGMSGAPLVNQQTGKLCGMVKFSLGVETNLGGGAIPVSVLREKLPQYILNAQKNFHRKDRRWRHLLQSFDQIDFRLLACISVMSALFFIFIRSLGWLQPLELFAYDIFLSKRSPETIDKHVAIVGVTGVDSPRDSISDGQLLELLRKIQAHNPKAIGLDIYRYQPDAFDNSDTSRCHDDGSGYCQLVDYLKDSSNIVATCQVGEGSKNDDAHPPYPDIANDNYGFVDALRDEDYVVRRHLLAIPRSAIDEIGTPCQTSASFSLRLAFQYLQSIGIPIPEKGSFQLGKIDLEDFILGERAGGYKKSQPNSTENGFQILLNYRHPLSNSKQSFELIKYDLNQTSDRLETLDFSAVEDRIVMVGYLVVDPDKNPDSVLAPQWYGNLGIEKAGNANHGKIPGVFIQTHKVSQLINAVLEDRPLLRVWSWQFDFLWILGWGGIAGIIVWRFRKINLLFMGTGLIVAVTAVAYLGIYLCSIWIPLVPTILGISFILITPYPTKLLLEKHTQRPN